MIALSDTSMVVLIGSPTAFLMAIGTLWGIVRAGQAKKELVTGNGVSLGETVKATHRLLQSHIRASEGLFTLWVDILKRQDDNASKEMALAAEAYMRAQRDLLDAEVDRVMGLTGSGGMP